jgi:hypothetical protein
MKLVANVAKDGSGAKDASVAKTDAGAIGRRSRPPPKKSR